MSTFADDDRIAAGPRRSLNRPAFWAIASAVAHLFIIAWLLASPEPAPMTMADRQAMDRPPVEMVTLQIRPNTAPRPEADVATDRPDTALPPRVRMPRTPSEIAGGLETAPLTGIEAIDPAAIDAYLKRLEQAEKTADGMGATWRACSLLSPERRILEPACDGLLLKRGEGPGVAASLQTPDGEVLAAIRKIEESDPAAKKKRNGTERDVSVGEDNREDRSYRNTTDDRFGPMPWE